MGTTLAGNNTSNNYRDVLQLGNAGAGFTGFPIALCDGAGNPIEKHAAPVPVPSRADNREATQGVLSGKYLQQTPAIQQITANTSYLGGRRVLIQGSGFLSCVSVTFGGVRTKWACVNSDSVMWCYAPPTLTAGAVDVVVTCAANPGGTAPTATSVAGFTYAKYSNGGTQTNYYQAASPGFYGVDAGNNAQTIEGDDGVMYFTCGLSPFTVTNAVAQVQLFTPGSSVFTVIANQNPYQFADNRFHGVRGLCAGGDGMTWGFDHHTSIIRISPLDPTVSSDTPGEVTFAVERWTLNKTGDQTNTLGAPGFMMTGPDGWLYLFGQTTINGNPNGQIWKINPFNPLQQQLRNFPGYSFQCAECGVDGTMYAVSNTTSPQNSCIVQMDAEFNIIQTVPIPFVNGLAGNNYVVSIILAGDLKFYCSLSTSTGANYILQLGGANLSTQNSLLFPSTGYLYVTAAGSDGNVWAVAQNGVTFYPTQTDSVVYQVSPSSFTVLNTYTLTDSVGGSPTTHPGNAGTVVASNLNGKMYVTVGQDEEASPSVQGWVVEIG